MSAQLQRRPAATPPVIQVPSSTASSTEENGRIRFASIHNKPDVHEHPIDIEVMQSRNGGKGHGKGSRDRFIGNSDVGDGGAKCSGGFECLGSCEEGHVGTLVEIYEHGLHTKVDHECGHG